MRNSEKPPLILGTRYGTGVQERGIARSEFLKNKQIVDTDWRENDSLGYAERVQAEREELDRLGELLLKKELFRLTSRAEDHLEILLARQTDMKQSRAIGRVGTEALMTPDHLSVGYIERVQKDQALNHDLVDLQPPQEYNTSRTD